MEYSVLGPLRVSNGHGPIEVRGAKEQVLLAHLVAARGRMVPATDLIDSLWGDDPPRSAAKSLQTFVLRLRNRLEPERQGSPSVLVTDGPGYRLRLDPADVDAERFTRQVALGTRAREDGRADESVSTLTEALAMWRGPAYAGFEHTGFGRAENRRLEELRLAAAGELCAGELDLGHTAAVIPEVELLLGEHPLRERLWELLMLALYRAGRQGDALAAYDRARGILADELGVDPGPELRAMQAKVLSQDPGLAPEASRATVPRQLRPSGRPLLGRGDERDRLGAAWRRATGGDPVTVVLRGPSGAGATSLAAALAEDVARRGALVLYEGPGAALPTPTAREVGTRQVLLVADHVAPSVSATLTLIIAGEDALVPRDAEPIDLQPLAPHEVRDVVSSYVEPRDRDPATAVVVAESEGWPGRVHEAAVRFARGAAARRVESAVLDTDATSASLASARAELTEGVAALSKWSATDVTADPDACPWRGLAAYGVADAPWFAGRERLVAELAARLAGARLIGVVGASGSGKSSAIRAGLLAALANDVLPGSAAWRQIVIRPGAHPMRELASQALGAAGPEIGDLLSHLIRAVDSGQAARTVLVVDQLEEVWTACRDEGERAAFLDTLAALAQDRREVLVVVAIRADYLGDLAEHTALTGLLADSTVLVGSPTQAEVRRAVERPAERAGLVLDDGLADTLVTDAGAEPGLLPLLSTALTRLWARRSGRSLTFAAYVAMGGLNGAIATLAEEVYSSLTADQQSAARLILLRLTGPGDGATVTRRRVSLAELSALPGGGHRPVIESLTEARLLTTSDGYVEVAHEALFREWPRLRGWLVEDAAGRAVQRRLAVAASEWDADGREASALWSGTRLASGLEVAEARPDEITSTEAAFLVAGQDALEAEQQAAEQRAVSTARQNRRLRWLLGGLAIMLVTAVVAGYLAVQSRRTAEAATVAADAKRLAASALNIDYPDLALLAAVEATKAEQSPETYGALLTLLARQPAVVHRIRTKDRFLRGAVSPDGRTVYLSENEPRIRAVDALTGRTVWDVATPGRAQVGNITVTADGTGLVVPLLGLTAVVARLDARSGGEVWRVDASDMTSLAPGSSPAVGLGGLRRDGRYVFETDSHVFAVDTSTGALLSAAAYPSPMPFTERFHLWPDGRVARPDPEDPAKGLLFDPAHPSKGYRKLRGVVLSVSPVGHRAVLGVEGTGGSALRLIDTDTLKEVSAEVRVPALPRNARWSPDGKRIALTLDTVQVIDADTLAVVHELHGHSGTVMDAYFAGPDRDLVWTAGRDGTGIGFDLSGARTPITSRPADPEPHVGDASITGNRGVYLMYFEDEPNSAQLVDTSTGRNLGEFPMAEVGEPQPCTCQVASVAIAPDGTTALIGLQAFTSDLEPVADTGYLALWDTRTRSVRGVVRLPWTPYGIAVTPDGERAVLNGGLGTAVLDLERGVLLGRPITQPEMPNMDFTMGAEASPDGRWAALARGGEVVVVDVATGRVARRGTVVDADYMVQALAWSADSATIAAGSSAGRLHFLAADTLEPAAPSRLITGGWVTELEVSRDGRLMASVGTDGDVTLWDTATWRPYGQPLTDGETWGWATFPPSGSILRVFFDSGVRTDISVNAQDWVRAACAAANRNLTPEESAVILPGRPITPTCADVP